MDLNEANQTRDSAIAGAERLHDSGYLYHLQGLLKRVANLERALREHTDAISAIALSLARAEGWSEDVSPGTERSNENWWACDACYPPIREEDLVEKFWDAAEAKFKVAV